MHVFNLRLGHACNSSSTHSIVVLPPDVGGSAGADANTDQEFGWENFTLRSREAKLGYLGQLVYGTLRRSMSDSIALATAQAWCGVPVAPQGYIDHQSEIVLPMLPPAHSSTPRDFDEEFVRELRTLLERDDVAVLGGNDNAPKEERHPLAPFATRRLLSGAPRDQPGAHYVSRKDGDYWVLFAPETGAKVRFSFVTSEPYTKATRPELIDVKITDQCSFGCTYCYQDSTPTGKHANLSALPWLLCELKPFEVAIGGGEPTQHPKLLDFLRDMSFSSVVTNLTTRNLRWLVNKAADEVATLVGAVALSVDGNTDLAQVWPVLKASPINVGLQYVMGTASESKFVELLQQCAERRVRLTLLGYKETGRGARALPTLPASDQTQRWIELARYALGPRRYLTVGIDTALAAQTGEQLRAAQVSSLLYTTQEGAFSCYYDAVTQRLAPSSYADPSTFVDCRNENGRASAESVLTAFRSW